MSINLYLGRCPIEEGKVTSDKFVDWYKHKVKEEFESMLTNHKCSSIRCDCKAVMKLNNGTNYPLHLMGNLDRTCNREHDCIVYLYESQDVEEIKKYFKPVKVTKGWK